MTVHDTKVLFRNVGIKVGIAIGIILIIVLFVRIGFWVKDIFFPPVMAPPTQDFGELPPYNFPNSKVDGTTLTYSLETTTGELPTTLSDGKTAIPDRLRIFPIITYPPNFLNLAKAKDKVADLGFYSADGKELPEIQLTNPYYEWYEPVNYNRKITFDINSFDFRMTSNFLLSLTVLSSKSISDEKSAIDTAKSFLETANLVPEDLDLEKTENKDYPANYVTYPQLFAIENNGSQNVLVRTTSLSRSQAIRVDFYQKDLEYELDLGGSEYNISKVPVTFPIVYPDPPYSLMSFWVASGPRGAEVTQAFFTHKSIDLNVGEILATYPIKTPEEAYAELTEGRGYIAAYSGSDNNVRIKSVYLAYYLGEGLQDYIMPVYVFEGDNGFFAYIAALR